GSIGVFVEIYPGKEGLVRLSELADYRVARPEDVVSIGDEIMVRVIEVDPQGRVNLSRRAVLEGPSARTAPGGGGGFSGPPGGRSGPPGGRSGPPPGGPRRPPMGNAGPGRPAPVIDRRPPSDGPSDGNRRPLG